jgi:hypothetical protein
MVTYVATDERIVFTAQVEGFGPVEITSRRPGIFSGRLPDRKVLSQAMKLVEDFVDQNKAELSPIYARIATTLSAA